MLNENKEKIGIVIPKKYSNLEELFSNIDDLNNYNYLMIYLNLNIIKNETINIFKNKLLERNINPSKVIIHSSLFTNISNIKDNNVTIRSIMLIKRELFIMQKIGMKKIVLHPGSCLGLSREDSLRRMMKSLRELKKTSPEIEIIVEMMCKTNFLCNDLQQINFLISQEKWVKICIDICHLYSSGYDIKYNFEKVVKDLENKIGLEKISLIHINDSKGKLGSKKDLHANIGMGEIGKESLKKIVKYFSSQNIIQILETPMTKPEYYNDYKYLINVLEE